MIRRALTVFATVAGAAAVASIPASAATPGHQAARDWSRTVALTDAGGFRMGNPAAKVKLIEYGSLTCPHCAHFAAEGGAAVRNLVKTGKLSFEYRNFVLNGPDVAATLLARCGGPKDFFAIADAMYATQPKWLDAITNLTAEQKAEINGLPVPQRLYRMAEASGLAQLAAKSGVSAAKARQCAADEKAMATIERLKADGAKLGVTGTPTFFINGEKAKAFTWTELEPAIRAALGSGG